MNSHKPNFAFLKFCAWMGPCFVLVFLIGAVILAGFMPPPSATNSAQETFTYFKTNLNMVRLGSIVMLFASTLYACWCPVIVIYTRIPEGSRPILLFLQLIFVVITSLDIFLIGLFWCFASYRPDQLIYDITQMWNDAAWMTVLITVPPFTAWCFVIAASIVNDSQGDTKLPRWAAYFNAWAGASYLPAAMMIFFKSGPFSQNGIIAFWLPVCAFFTWIVGMTFLVLRAMTHEQVTFDKEAAAKTRT